MKTTVSVHAIEATIWVDEGTGEYVLELKMEFADGTVGEVTKRLSKPSFRLELFKEDSKEENKQPDKKSN